MNLDLWMFGIYPYIASAIFFLGSIIRYDREQFTWKAQSSQMLSSKNFRIASVLFHVGIIMIFFGHFAGMVVPYEVWDWLHISKPQKQMVAMVVGGLFGTMCFIGLTMLVFRRLFNPRVRASSSVMDTLILLLLYAQLILGLASIFVSAGHTDGAAMFDLMNWVRYVMTFRPDQAVAFLAETHWIYKAHIFWGMTIFVLFPFSRLVHIWSVPVKYVGRKHQIVRRRYSL